VRWLVAALVLCAFVLGSATAVAATLPSGRASYRAYADYVGELRALADAHPGLVRRVVLPVKSIEGREIEGVEIADGVGSPSDGRPVALVVGLTHAREWPSGEVAIEYALDLVAHRSQARIAALLRRVRTVVIPVANPDGLVATQSGDPLRRRNCRALPGDDPNAPCARRRGVDLNRNYGAFWGGNGASTSPDQDTYRGSGPWSEPETQAVHEFTAGLPITDVVSLHNVAGLVLRPPGFRALGVAPDETGLRALGDAMARAAGYRSEYAADLYEATGALEDWNYVAQGAYGYTVELGENDGDGSFQGHFATHVTEQYFGAGGGLRKALLLAGEQAQDPRDSALFAGTAPAGRVLRLSKHFDTFTSPICTTDLLGASGSCATTAPAFAIADDLSLTLTVPAAGRFSWHVGPSTRPFVAKAGGSEAWTLDCLDGATVVASHAVVVGRGARADVAPCSAGAGVRVRHDPAAHLLRVGTVSRAGLRIRVRATCARSCQVSLRARDRSGGLVGTYGLRTLAASTPTTVAVRVPAGLGRASGMHLAVSAVDAESERATVTRAVP
jgi:hypothetical protein